MCIRDRYINRTSEELKSLLVDSRYGEDAKMAANEILKERESKSDL